MLEFDGVSFSYEAGRPAVRDLTFALAPGRVLAVVGANGSGKSTLARLANGLLTPSSGAVRVDGHDTSTEDGADFVRSRVGVVFQNPDNQIVGTTVEEDVAFGPENLGVPRPELRLRVDEALSSVGLTGMETREPHLLSEGQKQRVALAGALAMQPDYLVLDEPTSMLDPAGRDDVLRALRAMRAAGHGILHVTHRLEDTTWADEVLVLSEGGAAFLGDPASLVAEAPLLESAGMALPQAGVMAEELRVLGHDVPASALEAESVVAALWP